METEGGILVLVAGLIVGIILISAVAASRNETEQRLRTAALRLGAGFQPGGLFELPTLTVRVLDCFGRLTFAEGKNVHTNLSLSVPRYRGGALDVRQQVFSTFFEALFGIDRVRVGHASFDEDFVVRAQPPELVRWIFAPERMAQVIGTFRRMTRFGTLLVSMRSGQLEVRVGACLQDESALRNLLTTAAELLGYMLTAPGDDGVRWAEGETGLTGICPVCSTALCEPVQRCTRCRMPHHTQCWEYLGRCAVYGCQPENGRRAA